MEAPHTAFMAAVREVFARIGAPLPATLREPVRAVLVGGVAVHVHTRARVSNDAEAIFSRRLLLPRDLVVRYVDEAGEPRTLAYDTNYFSELALLHPDAESEAIDLDVRPAAKLSLAVLTPTDLVVSKLGRYTDRDRDDVLSLARAGLLDVSMLRQRAEEALGYYVGDPRWILMHLDDATAMVRFADEERSR